MALFYTGPRPVTKGRNFDTATHPIKGAAVYSNWLIFSPDQVFDGAPNTDYNPTTGIHARHLAQMSGPMSLFYKSEMRNSGNGNRTDDGRYRPLEFKGVTSGRVFSASYGHTATGRGYEYSLYNNALFDGVASSNVFESGYGHIRRFTTTYGGAFDPYVFKGVAAEAIDDPGKAIPSDYGYDYGFNRVNEWQGVPSSKAL